MHDVLLFIAFLLFCVCALISFMVGRVWVWVLGFAALALLSLGLAIPIDISIG